MPANVQPIYTVTPHVAWASADGDGGTAGPVKTQNTAMDGTGTINTVFTAGASGSYLKKLRCKAAGTNVASVVRIFINNGSTNATIANNILYDEATLPATTANAAAMLQPIEVSFEFALPASYKILVVIGTTVAAGWWFSVVGGDY